MSIDPSPTSPYWRKTRRFSAILIALWLCVTLLVGLFGRSLEFALFGWPFGFWITAQLALLLFCVLVWAYALGMDRIDRDHADDGGD
jgi:putative solute:sodium symporter small subunit